MSTAAFQELYELTQRKFLRQLYKFSEKLPNSKCYPKLFCIDLVDSSEFSIKEINQTFFPSEIKLNTLANKTPEEALIRPKSSRRLLNKQSSFKKIENDLLICIKPM